MTVNEHLEIAEIVSESGSVKYRYSRYLTEDRSRWIRHGLFVAYFPDGSVASEVNYSHGVEDGASRDYHSNGRIAATGFYKAGKEHGQWEFFDIEGRPERSVLYEDGIEV